MARVAVAIAALLVACSGAAPPAPTRAPIPATTVPSSIPVAPAPIAPAEDVEPEDAPAPRSRTASLRAHGDELRARRGNTGYVPPARTKATGCIARGPLPDAACTPGAVMTDDLAVICRESTRRRRLVPSELRHEVLTSYGYPLHPTESLEVDHLVPLELGGDNSIENLWPEPEGPGDGFREKDRVEHYLHRQVCRGAISLRDAQRAIATDWRSVLHEITTARVGER